MKTQPSIAEQIRKLQEKPMPDYLQQPAGDPPESTGKSPPKKARSTRPPKPPDPEMVIAIKGFENGTNMVHIRISEDNARKLSILNMEGISIQKFGAYAIHELLNHPEIKSIIIHNLKMLNV